MSSGHRWRQSDRCHSSPVAADHMHTAIAAVCGRWQLLWRREWHQGCRGGLHGCPLPPRSDTTCQGCFEVFLTSHPSGVLSVRVVVADPVESLQPRRQRLDWVGPGRCQVMEEMVRPPVRGVRISPYNGPPPTTGWNAPRFVRHSGTSWD